MTQLKDLKFRPSTDERDYVLKTRYAIAFLKDGNKVKAVVQFRGWEITDADLGRALLRRLIAEVAPYGRPETPPRHDDKNTFVIFTPLSKNG
jgi:translation initiation factor IF-3